MILVYCRGRPLRRNVPCRQRLASASRRHRVPTGIGPALLHTRREVVNKGSSYIGTCALCKQSAPLCDSHLIPKAVFRLLRRQSIQNKSPVIFGDGFSYQTDTQIADYLLCRSCENRFDHRGEKWVLRQCYRGDSGFRLRSCVESVSPDDQYGDLRIYSLAKNHGLTQNNTDSLIYFAMSVFWRAGARTWSHDGRRIHVELGAYLEPIRLFLNDEAPFPPRIILVVRIISTDKISGFTNAPESRNENGYHCHSFTIPGLMFFLYVGARLPGPWFDRSTAPNPGRYVSISPSSDMKWLSDMAAKHRPTRP